MFLLSLLLAAPPGDFVVAGTDAERATGRIVKIAADGGVELATDDKSIVVRDAISIRKANTPIPPLPRGPVLLTSTGDRILLQKTEDKLLLGGTDQSLHIRPAFISTEWDVPVSYALLAWQTKPPAETPFDPTRYSWLPAERNRDIVRLRNGDLASGTFLGFTEDGALKFKPETGDQRSIAANQFSALAFNPTLSRGRKVKGPYARLVLRDGTRLGVVQFTAGDAVLKGKTLFGQAVEVPLSELVALDVIQGKATDLADVKPKKVEQAAFLGTAWPWAANRTVRGEPLRLLDASGESTFDRGLGTHPRTILTYDLSGKFKRFEALVGLDAATGERGRAVVKVLVDGKEQPLPELAKLAAGPAVPLSVSIAGAKELTLIVDFGPDGDVQADVNWGDARLVE
jgi:hypothetical protein